MLHCSVFKGHLPPRDDLYILALFLTFVKKLFKIVFWENTFYVFVLVALTAIVGYHREELMSRNFFNFFRDPSKGIPFRVTA